MRALLMVLMAATVSGSALAQTPAKPAAVPPAGPAAPPAVEGYAYRAEGRRDPFLNLTHVGSDPHAITKRGDGPAAFTVGEISVRGVLQSSGSLVAMIQGPDNKTYVIHQGDKLADGIVKTVTPQGLVVVQDISDPLSMQKQREVRKLLRSLEDAKERL